MDCYSYNNFNKPFCQMKRLINNCKKFNGKISGNVCKVGKFNMALSDSVFEYKKDFQDYKLMSPEEFLRLTPDTYFNRDNIEQLKEKIINKEMDVLFLDVDVDSCQVLDHEGRNRAKASEELGIDKVPVVIFKKEFDPEARGMFGSKGYHIYSMKKIGCEQLKRQKSN